GGRQRRAGEKQHGDQTSRVPAHSSPHLQGVFAVPVTFIVTSAGVVTMPSSAYARITYVPGSLKVTRVVALPSLTAIVVGLNVTLPGPRQCFSDTAIAVRLGFKIAGLIRR